jgi:hypothetical protein
VGCSAVLVGALFGASVAATGVPPSTFFDVLTIDRSRPGSTLQRQHNITGLTDNETRRG